MLALLIGSAFLHALWNAVLKVIRSRQRALLIIIGVAVITSTVAAVGGELMGYSALTLGPWAAAPWVVASGLGEALYIVALSRVYDTMPLGVGYLLLRSFAMVGTWAVSIAFFAEPVTAIGCLGVGAVALGMWLTEGARRRWTAPNFWVVCAAIGVVGYHVGYGQGMKAGADPATLIAVSLGMSLIVQLLVEWRHCQKRAVNASPSGGGGGQLLPFFGNRRDFALAVGAGVVCAISFLGFLYGLKETHAGVGISIRNSSIVFAQLLAFFAGERLRAVQWAGVVVVFGGVLILGIV